MQNLKLLVLLEAIGSVKAVEEDDLHIVTALSGSGPAYFYYFAEQFEAAAIKHGLDKQMLVNYSYKQWKVQHKCSKKAM